MTAPHARRIPAAEKNENDGNLVASPEGCDLHNPETAARGGRFLLWAVAGAGA